MKRPTLFLILALAGLLVGCQNDPTRVLWEQINTLQTEKNDLAMRLDVVHQENETLKAQNQSLSVLKEKGELENLNRVIRIEMTARTGLFDKDKNGTQETLIVYLQPIDTDQDVIKAYGSVTIQLWNLEAANKPLLKEWHIPAKDLMRTWGNGLTGSYFRLTFDVSEILAGNEAELTIKAAFIDYLSGAIQKRQVVLKP